MSRPEISFVVPTLNEAAALPLLLDDLRHVRLPHEVIVADGDSTDATRELALAAGATVVIAAGGRGRQLRRGAATARGRALCVLHADVRLSADARDALARVVSRAERGAFAFSLRIAAGGMRYRIVEWGANARSRMAHLPFGDQGLVVWRDTYVAAGGFPDVALFEDVVLVRALRRLGPVHLLPERIVVSARRWEHDGVLRRTLRNWNLLTRYFLGADPEQLAKAYAPSSAVRRLRE